MTGLELAYIIGFYEGEGTCAFYRYDVQKQKSSGRLTVRISQNERNILDWIRKKIGYGSIHYVGLSNCWYLDLSTGHSRHFLNNILSRMRVPKKIKQAKLALKRDKKYIKNPRRNYVRIFKNSTIPW